MRRFAPILYFLSASIFLMSCSGDQMKDNVNVLGTWKLTNWTINVPVDLNDDGISSINLLEEIDCNSNETLVFEENNIVTSNDTFSPEINIFLKDGSTKEYVFNVECQEGYISFATTYVQNSDSTVEFNGKESIIIGNKLSRVYENAIEIYNENFSEVVETKDLTLIYTKLQ